MKDFPKTITSERVLKELRWNRDQYCTLQKQEKLILAFGKVISDLADRADGFLPCFGWNDLLLNFTLKVKGFTAADEPRLMEFISLAESGFKSEVYSTSDDPYEGERSFFLRTDHKLGRISVRIKALLSEEGLCKRVKVGTRKVKKIIYEEKVIDEDVYEIAC